MLPYGQQFQVVSEHTEVVHFSGFDRIQTRSYNRCTWPQNDQKHILAPLQILSVAGPAK